MGEPVITTQDWVSLQQSLDGEIHRDLLHKNLYATDASIYREIPIGVAFPRHETDLQRLVEFAHRHRLPLIPRAAGTSLAGQCVGQGLIVDTSKHFTRIVDFSAEKRRVCVEPGIIRDELNLFLEPYGLFFGPNTSTSNRCMIGGMVGNNSSGTTSIRYGVTRDHVHSLRTVLSDGSIAEFMPIQSTTYEQKQSGSGLEGEIYRQMHRLLSNPEHQSYIRSVYPHPQIHRRNTGYALDALMDTMPFTDTDTPFNFCKLLCGSEGTLAFTSQIELELQPLPPPFSLLLCAHFESVQQALQAVLLVMQQQPYACELMDKVVLDCTVDSRAYQQHRFFIKGNPAAVLMVELRAADSLTVHRQSVSLIQKLKKAGLGYAYPVLNKAESRYAWELRKAGLGLLSNLPGDNRPVACIEDTAVALPDLPAYIADFEKLMQDFGQKAVYYAHAGAGELHLRPILNLKKKSGRKLLYDISRASAKLVKKYKGSLSGEHGDGRVRAPFLDIMIGEKGIAMLAEVKQTWDPVGIFNPGKIVDAKPMNVDLRFSSAGDNIQLPTVFDYQREGGILRAIEKCNGSGDCRKLPAAGGVMCPSYHVSRDEKDSTRGRANMLREILLASTHSPYPFNHPELWEVLEWCIACKGCTGECPSDVDMAGLKAEFLHQYYKSNRRPMRDQLFAHQASLHSLAARWPSLSNAILSKSWFAPLIKKIIGLAPQRNIPKVHTPLSQRVKSQPLPMDTKGEVILFCDEFTLYLDVEVGRAAIAVLTALGYRVLLPKHAESGRAAISKGMLQKARRLAERNVRALADKVSADVPLIGLEPSALYSFVDEYPRLVSADLRSSAQRLASHCVLFEDFIAAEYAKGRIQSAQFHAIPKSLFIHGHCHQKTWGNVQNTAFAMSIPSHYQCTLIQSGCCGMAGSFGYEKEHYDFSMRIGELQLFPTLRTIPADSIIVASGTSCRHQIADGTQRSALHPAQVLWQALLPTQVG